MNQAKTEYFRKLLHEHEEHYKHTIHLMKEHNEAQQSVYTPGELSYYDNHPAELGSVLYEMEHNSALMVHEEYLLGEVHDAIKRMKEGTYGTCTYCGKDIVEKRLEAIPYARLCIDCQNSREINSAYLNHERSNEELHVWDAPMGRKYLNEQEDDEHEGMDYFNDVEKYGSSDTPQDLGGYEDFKEFYTNEVDYQGTVDHMDNVSNEEYKRQLPDT